jgi:hypothetical protein
MRPRSEQPLRGPATAELPQRPHRRFRSSDLPPNCCEAPLTLAALFERSLARLRTGAEYAEHCSSVRAKLAREIRTVRNRLARTLCGRAQCFGNVGQSGLFRIAYLHTSNTQEATLGGGFCHFLADAAQPSLKGSCVAWRLSIEGCRHLSQIGKRPLDDISRLSAGKIFP